MTISEGMIIKASSGKIYRILRDSPLNIDEIRERYKSNNLGDCDVLVAAQELTPNPLGGFTNLSKVRLSLKPGARINIIRLLKTQKGFEVDPKVTYIFRHISSEPSLILKEENPKVQISLEIDSPKEEGQRGDSQE